MKEPGFEWDEEKNQVNIRKHGIGFAEAGTVFRDEHALLLFDPAHSDEEDRYVLLGFSHQLRMLVVCHCYRDKKNVIRIYSARKATKAEQKQYNQRKP